VKEPVENAAASILARLRNQSLKMERPFAEILQYFAMERFLYRLSKTSYANKFILKGGLMFYVWDLPLRRPQGRCGAFELCFGNWLFSVTMFLIGILRF
jgi:hypothetical protein